MAVEDATEEALLLETTATLLLLLELATIALELDLDVAGVDEAAVPHKLPVILGALTMPLAWKPKLADAPGARLAFQPKAVAV